LDVVTAIFGILERKMWWKKFKVFPNLEGPSKRIELVIEKPYFPEENRLENSTEESNHVESALNTESALNHDKAALMVELENSRLAAAIAKKASECALADLQLKFDLATKLAEVESIGLIKSEQNKSQMATVLASKRSERKLTNQRLSFESAAVASSDATNIRISALKAELEVVLKKLKLAELERVVEEDPQSALFIANTARFVCEAMQKSELEAAIRDLNADNKKKMEAERIGSWITARDAKEEFDGIVEKMRLQYETAAAAATNASEQNMETLHFKTHLAEAFAKKNFESRLLKERAELKSAAEIAEKYNAVLLANQQCKYESAADAREREFKSSMDLQLVDSQTLIDAFNVEMVAKDLKYVVSKLTAERLEQQILTNHLEQQAKMANKESELLLSVCGNVAHDLNSPLLTLVLGIESLRSSFPQSGDVFDTLDSACAFMTSAISRTIDFTKVSSGVGLTPYKTAFDLRVAFNSPLKWIKAMLPQDGSITLECLPFPTDIFSIIISDQRWVEENLLCLLSNAAKYSSHGVVSAGVSLNKDKLRFTVEDNGVGIAEASKPMLFQQVSPVQRIAVGGSGLGLYSLSKRSDAIGGSYGIGM
jgi:signal transduction histidine kinase